MCVIDWLTVDNVLLIHNLLDLLNAAIDLQHAIMLLITFNNFKKKNRSKAIPNSH